MKATSSKTAQPLASLLASPPLLLAFFCFILIGIGGGVIGVLLPSLTHYYAVSDAVIGFLFLVSSVGYFISAFFGGALLKLLRLRGFLLLGAALFFVGTLGFGLELPFPLMLLMRLLSGLGVGIVETGLNIYVTSLPRNASLLTYLHAFYGVGAFIGPILASTILVLNWGWNSTYYVTAILAIVMLLGFWLLYRQITPFEAQEVTEEKSGASIVETLKLPVVWIASLFLLFYVGVEVSLGNWVYSLLHEYEHQPVVLSGGVVSGYWLGLTMGRFVLQSMAERFGISNTTLIYLCMGVIVGALLLIWFVPLQAITIIGFTLVGFALGPIYPLTVALTPALVPARMVPNAISFVVSISIIGLAVFPWIAGILAQSVGLWSLLPYNIALTVIAIVLWWVLFHNNKGSMHEVTEQKQALPIQENIG